MNLFRLLHIILACMLCMPAAGQYIMDKCFDSVWTGEDFPDGEFLCNTSDFEEDASDMVKYVEDEWQGTESAISAAPPIDCEEPRAVFLEVLTGEDGEGFGLKLSGEVQAGTQITFDVTYISHGPGSNGNFAPKLYSHHNSDFQTEGFINAQFFQTLPAAGNQWQTQTVTWNVTSASAGDDWIFFYSEDSSGMILNICQAEAGPMELGDPAQLQGCESEGLDIGEIVEGDIDYWWSTGATGPIINVNETGSYILYAQNACNVAQRAFLVVMHGDPEIIPSDINDYIFCEGDSLEISSEGLNVVNTWPDGSDSETYWINNEGVYSLTIEDDCGVLDIDLEIDYDTIPFVDLGPDRDLCEGQTLTLDGAEAGEVDYVWQDGNTSTSYEVNVEGTYALTVYNECGAYTDEVEIIYHYVPEEILPSVVNFCLARLPEFDISEFPGTYEWSDGSTLPTYTAQFTGYHWVDYTDDYFCFTVRDSVLALEGDCDCPIFLPNAFTPDDDGLNDVFKCEFECPPYDYTLEVYDRWGNVIVRNTTPGQGWDGYLKGRLAPTGVYHFRIWYRESFDGIPIEKFGTVNLIGDDFK